MMTVELRARLEAAAESPALLVGSDFDGTLAEIVPDPAEALPNERAVGALVGLAGLAGTHAAVISGRGCGQLAALLGETGEVFLIGCHGAEWGLTGARLTPEQAASRERIRHFVRELRERDDRLLVEDKPVGSAVHYRRLSAAEGRAFAEEAEARAARIPGVWTRHGLKVIEFMAVRADKGSALRRLTLQRGVRTVVFAGDDRTDEDVFAVLGGGDVGIKVGDGETLAAHGVGGVEDVAGVLEFLAERRGVVLGGVAGS